MTTHRPGPCRPSARRRRLVAAAPATTSGCTSPGCRLRGRRRCRSSCAATGRTSGTQHGQALPRRARRAVRGAGRPRAAPSWPRPPPSRPPSWRTSRSGRTRTRRRSSWPSGWPTLAPGDLNRVFFTTGGCEAVESAWKLARQYFKLTGKPMKHKVISRSIAYHGTTHGRAVDHRHPGAQAATFEPLVPGAIKVPNTNFYRAPEHGDDRRGVRPVGGRPRSSEAIEFEGPDTVAAVFLEPVQNSGGCFPPPPGYFQRVREICDRHDVLLVSDEVICAFGRLGEYFGADRYGYQPDIITCAKGMTSGYAPLGAMIVVRPAGRAVPARATTSFAHGFTFGGHPVSSAVALANLDIFEREDLQRARARRTRTRSGPPWRSCSTCRSSATSAATATSTASSWSRTRRPGRRSTTTSRSGCCAASCPRRCSTPASTAGPTTAATRSSSSRRR